MGQQGKGKMRGNFVNLKYKNIKKDLYKINEYGDIYSIHSKRILKFREDKDGYLRISLQTIDGRGTFLVHILVANTFLQPPTNNIKDLTVDHKDSNIKNNYYKNLRWMERGENSSIRKIKPKGEINGQHILTEKDVLEICELLIKNKMSLKEIGDLYNVEKSTISNIKRKKAWSYLTKDYDFKIKKTKNKSEVIIQKEEIIKLFKSGLKPIDIIKLGYPNTTVRRYYKEYSGLLEANRVE